MATSLTFTMTAEAYARLNDRLRHVMQFSEASRQGADEALALLEAAKGNKVVIDEREPADAQNQQLDRGIAELEAARDVDAVIYLLAVHKLLEDHASGTARHLARAEAMAIIAALNRVAPAVLDEALAPSEEQSEQIEIILDAVAPQRAENESGADDPSPLRAPRVRPSYDRGMTQYLHTMYRITDPERSRGFYEALGMEFRRELPIVRDEELEATNYFFGFPGQEEELELTFNHDGRSYELGSAYGHIAIGVDDLDGTLERLKEQGIEPEREPYRVREGGSRLCFVQDPDSYRVELIDRSGK